MTTPPEEPRTEQTSPGQPRTGLTMASNLDIARLPFLGNAEFLLGASRG